jgi:hypothetical protein
LPTASSTILGGIKVGSNLTISNGILSSTDTNTQLTDTQIGAMGYIKVDTNTQLTDTQIGAMGYIKVDTNTQVTVNNTLTSTSTTEALSANQGRILKVELDNKASLDDVIALAIALG